VKGKNGGLQSSIDVSSRPYTGQYYRATYDILKKESRNIIIYLLLCQMAARHRDRDIQIVIQFFYTVYSQAYTESKKETQTRGHFLRLAVCDIVSG